MKGARKNCRKEATKLYQESTEQAPVNTDTGEGSEGGKSLRINGNGDP